jgi:hypothetical protein
MPDLTIIHRAHCTAHQKTFKVQGSKGQTYEINWDYRDDLGYIWTCTCSAFKYGRGKPCKHIKALVPTICQWNEFIDGGSVTEDGKCPQCGHGVVYQAYGV